MVSGSPNSQNLLDLQQLGRDCLSPPLESNDTQVLPSQVYRNYNKSRDDLAAGSLAGDSHESETRTYETGDTGHINLIEDYDEEQQDVRPYGYGEEDGEQDVERQHDLPPYDDMEEDELGVDTQMRQGLVTSPPGLSPTTPGIAGRKRDHHGNVVRFASSTPRPDLAAAFPAMKTNVAIGLSQVFVGTQAASSPIMNSVSRAGLVFDRPSPDFVSEGETSPRFEESPVLTRRQPLQRSHTEPKEPKETYISLRESQDRRRKMEEEYRRLAAAEYEDEPSQDAMARRVALERKKAAIAAEFKSGIFAVNPPRSTRMTVSGRRSFAAASSVKTPGQRRNSDHAITISDDTPRPQTAHDGRVSVKSDRMITILDDTPRPKTLHDDSPSEDELGEKSEDESDDGSIAVYNEYAEEVEEVPRSSMRATRARTSTLGDSSKARRQEQSNRDARMTRASQSFPLPLQHGTISTSQPTSWHESQYNTYHSNFNSASYPQSVQVPHSQMHLPMPPRPGIIASSLDSRQMVPQSQQDLSGSFTSQRVRQLQLQDLGSDDEISSELQHAPRHVPALPLSQLGNPTRDEASMPSSPPIARVPTNDQAPSPETNQVDDQDVDERDIDELGASSQSLAVKRPPISPLSVEHVSRTSTSNSTPLETRGSQVALDSNTSRTVPNINGDSNRDKESETAALLREPSSSAANTATFHTAPTHLPKRGKLKPVRQRSKPVPETPFAQLSNRAENRRRTQQSTPKIPPQNALLEEEFDLEAQVDESTHMLDDDLAELMGGTPRVKPISNMHKRRRVLGEPSQEQNRLPPPQSSPKMSKPVGNGSVMVTKLTPKRGKRVSNISEETSPDAVAPAVPAHESPAEEASRSLRRVVSDTIEDPEAAASPRRSQRPAVPPIQTNVSLPRRPQNLNRVLAKFKDGQRNAYWPATCFGVSPCGEYVKARFDDGNVDYEVLKAHVRSFELRQGDVVRLDLNGHRQNPYIITEIIARPSYAAQEASDIDTDIHGNNCVTVVPKKPGNQSTQEPIEVSLSRLYVTSNLLNQFNDRPFTYVKSGIPERLQTPITGMSAQTTPSSRGRRRTTITSVQPAAIALKKTDWGLLANMAFAVSFSGKLDGVRGSLADEKNAICDLIRRHGGTVLQDGFHGLFDLAGTSSGLATAPDSSPAADGLLTLAESSTALGFVALIADTYSRSEKYMQALALDIPCVSSRWIRDSILHERLLPWTRYLLPAGESVILQGAVHSRTLSTGSSDAATATLQQTISRRPNLLEGKNVIIVASNRREPEKRKVFTFLTQALGAKRMTRVKDIVEARKLLLARNSSWDWVYVDDGGVEAAGLELMGRAPNATAGKRKRASGADGELGELLSKSVSVDERSVKVVGDEFVIQSLILGALIDEL